MVAAPVGRGADVPLTDLRHAVLELVLTSERPTTAYQLLDRLKATRPGAAPPTIYRALDFLMKNKLVHKVERLSAYVGCTGIEQHSDLAQFLICSTCGNVTELEDYAISQAVEQAAREVGFEPANSIIEVEGVCAQCRLRTREGC